MFERQPIYSLPASMVHSFAHHVHAEQALFALQQLPNPKRGRVSLASLSVGSAGPFGGVHVAVDVNLRQMERT